MKAYMMNMFLLAAAVASFLTFGIHTIAGGISIARPFLASKDLHDVVKYTQYYCWHITTIVLFGMSAGFMWATI